MQSFQRDLEKFESLTTQVLGISGDRLESHIKFSEEYDIAFPLISDEDMQIKNLYGKNRITYLIDKQGVIRFIQTGVPDNNEFLKEIRKLSEKSESHK